VVDWRGEVNGGVTGVVDGEVERTGGGELSVVGVRLGLVMGVVETIVGDNGAVDGVVVGLPVGRSESALNGWC
jgi:hypothetical protein